MNLVSREYEPILINFNIPKNLKYRFDRLVKFKGVSRTSILNRLVEDWVRDETKQLEEDLAEQRHFEQLMTELEGTIER